jgi:hypothetical protein
MSECIVQMSYVFVVQLLLDSILKETDIFLKTVINVGVVIPLCS